jgi:hypothetical protein
VLEPEADRATARALVEALLEIAHEADTTSMDRIQLVADRGHGDALTTSR